MWSRRSPSKTGVQPHASFAAAPASARQDLSTLRKPFYDPRQAFEDFKKEKIACWNIVGRPPLPRDSFVRPSGSLHSPIAHHLHQPSYSTYDVDSDDAETADWTSSVAMIMGNGFEEGVTFIFDHLHQRSQNSEGYDTYPKVVIQSHKRFTHRIGESIEAKVEVIYGAKVKGYNLYLQKTREKVYDSTTLGSMGRLFYLDHESNFNNHEEGHRFRRANVFPYHPQKLFFESPDSDVAVDQDLILSAAVKLAGINTPFTEDWHRKRKWRSVIPNLRPTETGARAVSAMIKAKQKEASAQSTSKTWIRLQDILD